jgi:hypothetical protein
MIVSKVIHTFAEGPFEKLALFLVRRLGLEIKEKYVEKVTFCPQFLDLYAKRYTLFAKIVKLLKACGKCDQSLYLTKQCKSISFLVSQVLTQTDFRYSNFF